MEKKIFFGIIMLVSVFLGVVLALVAFFKKFKFKGEVSFKDYEDDEIKKSNENCENFEEKIISEDSSEWETYSI